MLSLRPAGELAGCVRVSLCIRIYTRDSIACTILKHSELCIEFRSCVFICRVTDCVYLLHAVYDGGGVPHTHKRIHNTWYKQLAFFLQRGKLLPGLRETQVSRFWCVETDVSVMVI